MKRFIAINLGAIIFLLMAGCATKAPEAEAEKTTTVKAEEVTSNSVKQLGPLVAAYLQLKDALVAGDSKTASTASASFEKALTEFDTEALSAENKQRWIIRSADLAAKSSMLVAKSKLEGQRKAFYSLSQALIATVQDMGTAGSSLYVQHCPMAFGNTGADWLSDSEKVVNPYFGDAMLHCGTVKETLN